MIAVAILSFIIGLCIAWVWPVERFDWRPQARAWLEQRLRLYPDERGNRGLVRAVRDLTSDILRS